MTSISINDLAPAARRALALRAVMNGRRLQDEALAILDETLNPQGRLQIGSAMSALSEESGLTNADVDVLEAARGANPTPPMWFG